MFFINTSNRQIKECLFDSEILECFQAVVSKAKKSAIKGTGETKTATDEFDAYVQSVLNGSEAENFVPLVNSTSDTPESAEIDSTVKQSKAKKIADKTKPVQKQTKPKKKKIVVESESEGDDDDPSVLSEDEISVVKKENTVSSKPLSRSQRVIR